VLVIGNLLSLRQFSGCREALECGQILLKQASHKPGVAHDSMTCSIRLIRKETVFAAFLLRLIGAKHGEEGIAGDQLGMLLSSLQVARSYGCCVAFKSMLSCLLLYFSSLMRW
jgi:hypothetical protein